MDVDKLPIVFCANNPGTANCLDREFPGRLGVLLTPGHWKHPGNVPFVLDNGRYSTWSSSKAWDEDQYIDFLNLACDVGVDPDWIVVPDVVKDGEGTLKEWELWYDRLEGYGWKMALAVQDGMTVDDVLGLNDQPDLIFIGGSTEWKWRTAKQWAGSFDRVHIGRVATVKRLWMTQRAGAESSDSNIWRPIGGHLDNLRRYLEESEKRIPESRGFGF